MLHTAYEAFKRSAARRGSARLGSARRGASRRGTSRRGASRRGTTRRGTTSTARRGTAPGAASACECRTAAAAAQRLLHSMPWRPMASFMCLDITSDEGVVEVLAVADRLRRKGTISACVRARGVGAARVCSACALRVQRAAAKILCAGELHTDQQCALDAAPAIVEGESRAALRSRQTCDASRARQSHGQVHVGE